MGSKLVAVALAVMLLGIGNSTAATLPDLPSAQPRPGHGPILIDSDDDFAGPAAVSGVVGGSGSREDPYVIAGWTFVGDGVAPAIKLNRTRAHVRITGNDFEASGLPYFAAEGNMGVRVDHAENVTVVANTFQPMFRGVHALEARGLEVRGNTFDIGETGLRIEGAHGVQVAENMFRGGLVGALVLDASDLVLDGNRFEDVGDGFIATRSRALIATANAFMGGVGGATDEFGGESEWSRNVFAEQSSTHLRIHYAAGIRVHNNSFAGAPYALFMFFSGANIVSDNVFTGHVTALDTRFAVENEATRNTITDTGTPNLGLMRQRFAYDTNTVDGLPFYFVRGRANFTLDLAGRTAAGVIAYESPGFVLKNGTVVTQGVGAGRVDGARFEDLIIKDAYNALRVEESTRVTVAEVRARDNVLGILFSNVSGGRVTGSVVSDGVAGVLMLTRSHGNVLDGLDVSRVRDGVQFSGGSDKNVLRDSVISDAHGAAFSAFVAAASRVESTTITRGGNGILLVGAGPTTFRDTTVTDALYGVNILRTFAHDMDETARVNGRPIRIVHGAADTTLSPSVLEAGYLALVAPRNVTVTGYDISRNADGLVLVDADDVRVEGNRFASNIWGVTSLGSHADLTLRDNAVTGNAIGFAFLAPGNYTVSSSDITSSRDYAVYAERGTHVDARDNWWGSALGPLGLGFRSVNGRVHAEAGTFRPTLTTLPVNEDVEFAPWATSAFGAPVG